MTRSNTVIQPNAAHIVHTPTPMATSAVAAPRVAAKLPAWLAAAMLAMPLVANAGDAENGEKLVGDKGCVACHLADGNSTAPTFPILAGQYEDYLVQALKQYRSGARQNAIMGASAINLTDQEIDDLAAWFSSQESVLQYAK